MGVTSKLRGRSRGQVAEVFSTGGLGVTNVLRAASEYTRSEVEQVKVLSEKFADGSAVDEMNVDGSVTAQEFYIQAEADRVKWVTEIRLMHYDEQMSTSSQELRRFGSAAAAPGLTNGVLLQVEQGGVTTDVFVDTESTGAGVRNLTQYYFFGDVVAITGAVSSTVDAFWVFITLPAPVGLFPGSQDRVVITVQDDLSSLNAFEALAYGTYELVEAD